MFWSGATAARPPPFVAAPALRSGHAQTSIVPWLPAPAISAGERVAIAVDARVTIGGVLHRASPASTDVALIVHGIGGTGDEAFVLRTARGALARGVDALRLSMRGGGASASCGVPGLFHAGLTGDVKAVVAWLAERYARVHVIGFSLGGQIVLRAMGELGDAAPSSLTSVVGVAAPVDLAAGATYAEGAQATPYRIYIVRELKRRYLRACAQMGPRFPPDRVADVRTVRQYDDAVVAPFFGYRDAADYYARVESRAVLARIAAPTLLVHADDDPIVPSLPVHEVARLRLPNVSVVVTLDGGHVGHLGAAPTSGDRTRFWAEERALDWVVSSAATRRS